MGCPAQNGVHLFPRMKNGSQVLLDNSQNMDYHTHEMNIMFITICSFEGEVFHGDQ